MGLSLGYKPTEVGVLPQDWCVRPLGTLADITAGGTPSRTNPQYWGGTIPWITTSEIDFNVITEAKQFITEAGLQHSAARVYPSGTLLLALYGQGKTRGKTAMLGIDAATNQACAGIVLRATICRQFLFHFLKSRYREIRNLSHSGNQENLNGAIVRSIPVVLPSEREQERIAQVLDDIDSLLHGLNELIAKKRALKHATMQQLLTGRTRLPGCTNEWKSYDFGQLFKFLKTGNNTRDELSSYGEVGYVHYGDIHTHESPFLDCSRTRLPRIAASKVSRLPRLQDGDLVMADASEDYQGIGKWVEVTGVGGPIVAGLHTFLMRGDPLLLADRFKAYLQFIPAVKAALIRLATGISVYGISKPNVKSIEVRLPDIHEQCTIAEVISDMDLEINTLQERFRKTVLIRQGMVQQLLTGKTRLI